MEDSASFALSAHLCLIFFAGGVDAQQPGRGMTTYLMDVLEEVRLGARTSGI